MRVTRQQKIATLALMGYRPYGCVPLRWDDNDEGSASFFVLSPRAYVASYFISAEWNDVPKFSIDLAYKHATK